MTYTNLHCHSEYSLDGLSSAEKIVNRCKQLNMSACAITDHGTLSGVIDFISACQKNNIKPILGNELYISSDSATIRTNENRKLHHLVVMAKNKDGWFNLIKATSRSNDKDVYYYRPRLDYDLLKQYSKNLIGISGHPGSLLFNTLFKSMEVYDKTDLTEIESYLVDNPIQAGIKVVEFYKTLFDDFFIEINLFDKDKSPALIIAARILREIGRLTNTKCIAICDSHYANPEDVDDHRIIICSMLRTTLKKVQKQMDEDEFGLACFFKSNKHYIATPEELLSNGITQEELDNTNYVASLCENYNIFNKPILPHFSDNENESLLELCRKGYQEKKQPNWNPEIYGNRVKYELDFIQRFNLAGYFLIVQDYVNFAKKQGILVGPGRGCLTNTNILTTKGTKDISEIQIGDYVFSDDGNPHIVENTFKYRCKEDLLQIKTYCGDNNLLTLTKDHKVLVNRAIKHQYSSKRSEECIKHSKKWQEPTDDLEWIQSKDLKVGDWLFTPFTISSGKQIFHRKLNQGFLHQIKEIKSIPYDGFVYDIQVENKHNYLTTSGIVHNSCGASLVAYLISITEIDPIPPDLFFERFLNPGRYTKDNIEYPDIDMDFPSDFRDRVIQYIVRKYGKNCVSQIATFGRLLGAGALKEVLRVHDVCSFEEMNRITKHWPQEAEIVDELEKMEQYSIIRWILENDPEKVQDYCQLKDGKLVGDYAQYFEQAIRLEGVIKTQGKHAAGIIIAPHDLNDYCPMIYDKNSDDKIAGFDMHGMQKLGYIKFDILGVTALDKLMMIQKLIQERHQK